MKRNETVLVYAVTGLLLGILLVAVVFGRQPVVQANTAGETSVQLTGVTLDLMEAKDGANIGGGTSEPGEIGETPAGEQSGPGDEVSDGKSADSTEAGEPTLVALSKPIVVPEPEVLPEKLLEESFGTSRRDGDYRVVKGWHNATLAGVVERWTGSRAAVAEAGTLNESLGDQIVKGDEILVPWVDAESLLAAKKLRDSERQKTDWVKGELYVLKKGDSLWKVASRRVATNMIPAWLESFKGLNPKITNLGALMEGQKVRLPRPR